MKKRIIIISLLSCILAGIVFFIYILPGFLLKEVEIQRLNSSDGMVDAIIIERDAGAMTTCRTIVFIVPKDTAPNNKSIPVFEAKRIYDLTLTWTDKNKLIIKYAKADITHFRNYIYPFSNNYEYEIRVSEGPVNLEGINN